MTRRLAGNMNCNPLTRPQGTVARARSQATTGNFAGDTVHRHNAEIAFTV